MSRVLEIRHPGTGELVVTVPVMGEDEVGGAVGRAREAQRVWAGWSLRRRAWLLGSLADVLRRRAREIAGRVHAETGKPMAEALAGVVVSVDLLQYYRRKGPGLLRPHRVGTGWLLGKTAFVEREPYGVVGAILPWNYPFIMLVDLVAPALLAGNALVAKPSEYTPWVALLLPELLREAGFPDEVVQIVTGDGETGAALVRSGIDRVVFTGSTATGRKVGAAAGEALIPVTLELGGKDAAVVLEDADLDRAVQGICFGAMFNAGQTCLSVERAIVVEAVYEEFVRRAVAFVETLRAGVGAGCDVGPMVTPEQVAIVESQVEDAVREGARVLVGGARAAEGSRVYLPTVLVDVRPEMRIMREETFGPVLPVLQVADEEEAVREANRLAYGLFASVWTGDPARGRRVAARVRSGGVSVNDVLSHYGVAGLPVGGVGESGFGSRRGIEGLLEMTRARTVLLHRWGPKRDLWWFPYTPVKERLFASVLEWRARPGPVGFLRFLWRFLRGGAP